MYEHTTTTAWLLMATDADFAGPRDRDLMAVPVRRETMTSDMIGKVDLRLGDDVLPSARRRQQ